MNKALGAPLAVGFCLLCANARASDADPWFGPDKALHFGISVALASGGYAASSAWLDARNSRALAGCAFALTLGAGKELWDLSGHGDPSWRDFTWDVIGTVAGVALAASIDTLASPRRGAQAAAVPQGLVIRF